MGNEFEHTLHSYLVSGISYRTVRVAASLSSDVLQPTARTGTSRREACRCGSLSAACGRPAPPAR